MSIQTNELQQLIFILGTDSLLVDTASAGTARITLANLAKYFTEQDNAVKAALSNKAALSAQQRVEAVSVPSRTVEVEAAELPGYIAGLPRLLAENLTVEIKAGTVPVLFITRFYGPGSLTFKEKESGTVSFAADITIDSCRLPVCLEGLTIRNTSTAGAVVNITGSRARLKNCVFDRMGDMNRSCVDLTDRASAYVRGCAFNNSGYGVNEREGCFAVLDNCAGSGNVTGIVTRCGVILLAGTTPALLGGSANARWGGGLIVKKDGTLL